MNDLLEPVKLYKERLKEDHHERVLKRFDELVKQSGVDIEANHRTVEEYNKTNASISKFKESMDKSSVLKVFMIISLVLGLILLFIGIISFMSSASGALTVAIILTILGPSLFIFGLLMFILYVRPKRKKLQQILDKLNQKADKLLKEAYSQMAALNSICDASEAVKMVKETTPLINLDRAFTNERYEFLKKKYGFRGIKDEDHSYLGIQSGTILGNPFIFAKELTRSVINYRYEGTLVITWVTYVKTKNGSMPVTHTQTLHAYVTKPKPIFSDGTYLLYGNEAAPNLKFSRKPSSIGSMNEKEIAKYVRKHEDDLENMSKKAMKSGGTFTPLGNPEFELFFGGLDRNNEVEYRLLFTPLAQKSILDLLKSDVGYGDDFSMYKNKMINIIISGHMQNCDLFDDSRNFYHYDFEEIKESYIDYHDEFFKSIYFDLAPLLSIPLYQQHKAHEYIYQNSIKSNVPDIIHEVLANSFNPKALLHKDSDTPGVLKTRFIQKDGEADAVEVTASSYKIIHHTDYVPVRGGDGHIHSVPVHWDEYDPLEEISKISVFDLGISKEELRTIRKEAGYESFIKSKVDQNGIVYNKGVCSTKLGEHQVNFDVKSFKEIMHKS